MGVGFPTRLGPFYSHDGSGGAVAEGSVQIFNGPWIPARYNMDHWRPSLGELSFTYDPETSVVTAVSTRITVPQGLVGIPGKFHGGFRALLATVFAREAAGHFGIDPADLIKAVHNFKDSDFDGGELHLSVEKNRMGSLVFSINDNHGGEVSRSVITPKSSLRAIDPPSKIDISNFKSTHQLGCIGSCAVASPFPKQGLGLDYSFDKNSGTLMAALPAHITDIHSRLGFILTGSDDMAWFSGFFKSQGKSGTTAGIDIITFNSAILNQADLFIHVTAGESGPGGIIPVTAHIVNRFGLVAAKAEFKYIPEVNPLADNSVAKRLGKQFETDLRHSDQAHVTRNLTAYYDILGPDAFHDLMNTAQVPQDRLPQNLRRPTGYSASCFAVAGLSDAGSRILQSPFFQTENPFRSLSRSADRFASGVFGGVRSTLGMGFYDLLSGKSFNLEQLLTNTFGMLTVGALASSVINPSGFLGFTGHSLLTIGFNHLLSGDFSFSKEEVMTTLVSTLVGGSIEAGAMSGALKALGFAGKTFGHILSSQKTLGQVVETAFTQLTLGSLFSTLGLISSEATNQAMASFLQIEQPQPNMIA